MSEPLLWDAWRKWQWPVQRSPYHWTEDPFMRTRTVSDLDCFSIAIDMVFDRLARGEIAQPQTAHLYVDVVTMTFTGVAYVDWGNT